MVTTVPKSGRRTRFPQKRSVFIVSVCSPSQDSSDHQDDINETCLGSGGSHAKLSFATITSSGATPKVFRSTNLMSLSLSCVQILMPRSILLKFHLLVQLLPILRPCKEYGWIRIYSCMTTQKQWNSHTHPGWKILNYHRTGKSPSSIVNTSSTGPYFLFPS